MVSGIWNLKLLYRRFKKFSLPIGIIRVRVNAVRVCQNFPAAANLEFLFSALNDSSDESG